MHCLNILPRNQQRPTANGLLQHRFIKTAKETSYLAELIERYQDYRARLPPKSTVVHASVRSHAAWDANNTIRSDWSFDTVKSMSALGTYSGTVNDLLPSAMVSQDNEPFDDSEVNGSIDSEGATNDSDLITGIGMNLNAANSIIINAPRSPGPIDTTDEGARTFVDGVGTGLTAGLGTGVGTIRPVKKVDPVSSLRLSSEFVGSLRKEGSPTSPIAPRRASSETARVGGLMVDEIILPNLNNARFSSSFFRRFLTHILDLDYPG